MDRPSRLTDDVPAPSVGSLYVWGKDTGGNLGTVPLDRDKECPLPTRVPQLEGVQSVACGESATAAITASDGALWCWGAAHPRLGLGDRTNQLNLRLPQRVSLPERAAQIAFGEAHVLCITIDGRCWSWGKGNTGCLGDGDTTLRHARASPGPVLSSEGGAPLGPVVQVGAGFELSVALLASGEVCSWGRNDHGQLGIGRAGGCAAWPQRVRLPPAGHREDSGGAQGDGGAPPQAVAATSIACGSLYAGCITADGGAYLWGYGLAGNLGCGRRPRATTRPVRAQLPPGARAAALACAVGQPNAAGNGADGLEGPHTLLVCEGGALYAFGTHHKGLCGNLTRKTLRCSDRDADELVPYRIGGLPADTGTATAGAGERGGARAATGYLDGVRCVLPLSAHIHNAVLDGDGRLWAFGCGSSGRLGLSVYLTGLHGAKSRMKTYVVRPTQVELPVPGGGVVLHAATSRRCMAAVVAPRREASARGCPGLPGAQEPSL